MDRTTQADRVLALLRSAEGAWVPLPELLALGIAQYNARIFDLRRAGHDIECKQVQQGRTKHTFYRLKGQASLF